MPSCFDLYAFQKGGGVISCTCWGKAVMPDAIYNLILPLGGVEEEIIMFLDFSTHPSSGLSLLDCFAKDPEQPRNSIFPFLLSSPHTNESSSCSISFFGISLCFWFLFWIILGDPKAREELRLEVLHHLFPCHTPPQQACSSSSTLDVAFTLGFTKYTHTNQPFLQFSNVFLCVSASWAHKHKYLPAIFSFTYYHFDTQNLQPVYKSIKLNKYTKILSFFIFILSGKYLTHIHHMSLSYTVTYTHISTDLQIYTQSLRIILKLLLLRRT